MKMNQNVFKRVIAYFLAGLMLMMLVLGALPIFARAEQQPNPYQGLLVKQGDFNADVLAVQERLKDLGFFPYKPTMQFGQLTTNAVIKFQAACGLAQDGVVGGETARLLFSGEATRIPFSGLKKTTPEPPATPKASRRGKLTDWFDIKKKVKRGDKFQVIDLWTNKKYNIIMVGGYNHMDFEPATKADTATFKSTYGGSWSWDRRPVLIYIAGEWHAASVNGFPHGYETVANNNMYQQCCLHMLNSRTHEHNAKCPKHQRCVLEAAGKL